MPAPQTPTHLLTVFPSFAVGGAQARFCALARHLGQGWRHSVVAMDGNLACRERLEGLDVTFLPVVTARRDTLGTLRTLRRVLATQHPDVLLTHNWGAVEWGLANRWPRRLVRHVHVEDGFGPEERDRQLRRRVLGRRLALRDATLVLPSQTLLRLAQQVWRLDRQRCLYVPNGIDLTRFVPDSTRPGRMVVGVVAALRPEKNLGRLLDAVALVPGAELVVLGDGPQRPTLEAAARRLGIAGRVAFRGHQADPAATYAEFDVFALPSDTEQMPLTVLEAMASGLPVAATDVGDVAAMLAPENRPFVVARDAAALATALAALLGDAGLRSRLGAANRARAVALYGEPEMFQSWRRVLSSTSVADTPT